MTIERLEELLKTYDTELIIDVKVDMMTLRERLMTLSAMQHKWVSRLIHHKRDRARLYASRDNLVRGVVTSLKQQPSQVNVSESALRKQAEMSREVVAIDQGIERIDLAVEYLERMDKVFTQMGHALRNLVELMKLETT